MPLSFHIDLHQIVHFTVSGKYIQQAPHMVVMRVRNKQRLQIEKIQPFEISRMRTIFARIKPVQMPVAQFQHPSGMMQIFERLSTGECAQNM